MWILPEWPQLQNNVNLYEKCKTHVYLLSRSFVSPKTDTRIRLQHGSFILRFLKIPTLCEGRDTSSETMNCRKKGAKSIKFIKLKQNPCTPAQVLKSYQCSKCLTKMNNIASICIQWFPPKHRYSPLKILQYDQDLVTNPIKPFSSEGCLRKK